MPLPQLQRYEVRSRPVRDNASKSLRLLISSDPTRCFPLTSSGSPSIPDTKLLRYFCRRLDNLFGRALDIQPTARTRNRDRGVNVTSGVLHRRRDPKCELVSLSPTYCESLRADGDTFRHQPFGINNCLSRICFQW